MCTLLCECVHVDQAGQVKGSWEWRWRWRWGGHTGRGHWCKQRDGALTTAQSTKRPCMTGLGQQLMAPNYSFSVLQKAAADAWPPPMSRPLKMHKTSDLPRQTARSLRLDDFLFSHFGIGRSLSCLRRMAPCWEGRDGWKKKTRHESDSGFGVERSNWCFTGKLQRDIFFPSFFFRQDASCGRG